MDSSVSEALAREAAERRARQQVIIFPPRSDFASF
jgi:hypothetical protein